MCEKKIWRHEHYEREREIDKKIYIKCVIYIYIEIDREREREDWIKESKGRMVFDEGRRIKIKKYK